MIVATAASNNRILCMVFFNTLAVKNRENVFFITNSQNMTSMSILDIICDLLHDIGRTERHRSVKHIYF